MFGGGACWVGVLDWVGLGGGMWRGILWPKSFGNQSTCCPLCCAKVPQSQWHMYAVCTYACCVASRVCVLSTGLAFCAWRCCLLSSCVHSPSSKLLHHNPSLLRLF
jgi:hypothetical protein